jgi:hypothetical protein
MAKHIERKFYEYHKDNPKVYDLFVGFAKEANYARKMMNEYPEFKTFFRLRELQDGG